MRRLTSLPAPIEQLKNQPITKKNQMLTTRPAWHLPPQPTHQVFSIVLPLHPFRPVGLRRGRTEPDRATATDRAVKMPRHDFERVVPAVAEEPAPELDRIEHALVPA